MSSSGDKADLIAAPFAAASTDGSTGVFRINSITTASSVAIPKGWRSNYLRLKARDADIQLAFAGSAQTLVLDQASAPGTGNAAAGFTLSNGESIDVIVPVSATHLCYIAVSGTGKLEGFYSEGRVSTPKAT